MHRRAHRAATASCSRPAAARCSPKTTAGASPRAAPWSTCSAPPEDLYERMRHDRNRPLLADGRPAARACASCYAQRDPLYREIADLVVDTGAQSVQVARARAARASSEERWKALRVALGERTYPIHIGAGLLARAELYAPHLRGGSAAIVTNAVVAPLYLAHGASRRCSGGARRRRRSSCPTASRHKGWQTLEQRLRRAARRALRARRPARRAGRRRGRRPRRLRRGGLPARRAVRPGADDAARAGRFLGRRQDRDQPCRAART